MFKNRTLLVAACLVSGKLLNLDSPRKSQWAIRRRTSTDLSLETHQPRRVMECPMAQQQVIHLECSWIWSLCKQQRGLPRKRPERLAKATNLKEIKIKFYWNMSIISSRPCIRHHHHLQPLPPLPLLHRHCETLHICFQKCHSFAIQTLYLHY